MKGKISQKVRVGIFVTIGVILSMAVIFMLGDGWSLFAKEYTLRAKFQKVSGLRGGAPVFLAGIQVGKVSTFEFPAELKDTQIIVEMAINKQYQERIREDSTASIETQGLLGDKSIYLTLGTPAVPELKHQDFITVKQGVSLDTFAESGGELLESVNKLAKNIDGLISDIKSNPGLMHALIYDSAGEKIIVELAGLTTSAGKVVREIQTGGGMLNALIYSPVRKDFGKVMNQTVENFRDLSKDLAVMGRRIEKGEGSIGGLSKDPTVYYDLMTLLGKANRNKLLRTVIRATLATNEKDLTEK